MTNRHFIFTQLSVDNLKPGKEFEGLTVVQTRDMNGRPVIVTAEELPLYLANTQAALKAAVSESGELVGLPIDAGKTGDHDKGDAGGWIVGIKLVGNILKLIPKWTNLGRDIITDSIRRYFSPTIDTENKVILGGTLTNWPAQRNAMGAMLLKPIELSGGLYKFREMAMSEEMIAQIKQSFIDKMKSDAPDDAPEILGVDENALICKVGDNTYRVPFAMGEGGPTFAPRDQWGTVEPTPADTAYAETSKQGDAIMPVKLSELSKTDREALVTELAAKFQGEGAGQFSELAAKLVEDTRKQARLEFQAETLKLQRDGQIAELSTRLISGSPEAPRGLKNVTADDLRKHLAALPADESRYFSDLLAGITRDGLLEFSELGHSRKVTQLQAVPDYAVTSLTKALKAGATPAKFFELAGLGDPTHYDLTPFAAIAGGNGREK